MKLARSELEIREEIERFYDKKWLGHDGYWFDLYPADQVVYARSLYGKRNREILAAIPGDARRVLDVGCGTGDLLRHLAAPGRAVVGTDLARANVTRAIANTRRDGLERVFLAQSKAESLPFSTGSFDAVILADVIEHVPDVPAALREAARVLESGGVLVCVTPHAQTLTMLWRVDRWMRKPWGNPDRSSDAPGGVVYERLLSPTYLEGVLRDAGFHHCTFRRICFYPGPEGGGVFAGVMRRLHRVAGTRVFARIARAIQRILDAIERTRIFNQKQMWVARI